MSEPLIIFILFLGFIFYLIIDLGINSKGNVNAFLDKWVKKTLWLWLPVYGIWRLLKEVILKNKK